MSHERVLLSTPPIHQILQLIDFNLIDFHFVSTLFDPRSFL